MTVNSTLFDSLYGQIEFDQSLTRLLSAPLVQRLRHVRLSNIDSLAMPGISGGSRYEHVIGVAYLATQLGIAEKLTRVDLTCLAAAAMLHDWAITAFGHLVEEGFAYSGIKFDHEQKLQELGKDENSDNELGGINRQIFCGRESGLGSWIGSTFPSPKAQALLSDIADTIRGVGRFGRIVNGDIDIDNIDGVYRIAYHIGIPVDRTVPRRLAKSIVSVLDGSGLPVFRIEGAPLVDAWRNLRTKVYQHLMSAQPDFAAKLMLLRCTSLACKQGEILPQDWNLTDLEFISRLKASNSSECRKTVERWQVGEFWNTTPLVWMAGDRPAFAELDKFSTELSALIGRECVVYGIKDKRTRECRIAWDNGDITTMGHKPTKWLLGVGSPARRSFSKAEISKVVKAVQTRFETSLVAADDYSPNEQPDNFDQIRLI